MNAVASIGRSVLPARLECEQRVEALLKKHGRKMIGWDEVLDGGVSESTIVMSWTGVDGGIQAAKAGNDVIMTPHQYCYLNVPNSPDRDHEPPHGTRHPARRTSVTLDKAYGLSISGFLITRCT